jgi:hypothetical protein
VVVLGDLLGALLGDDDLVQDRVDVGVRADLVEQLGAELRPVHRGDADRDGARLGPVRRHVGRPHGLLQHGTAVASDDVEPVPPSVTEGTQRQLEGELLGILARRLCRLDAL